MTISAYKFALSLVSQPSTAPSPMHSILVLLVLASFKAACGESVVQAGMEKSQLQEDDLEYKDTGMVYDADSSDGDSDSLAQVSRSSVVIPAASPIVTAAFASQVDPADPRKSILKSGAASSDLTRKSVRIDDMAFPGGEFDHEMAAGNSAPQFFSQPAQQPMANEFELPELKQYTAPQRPASSPLSAQNRMLRSRQSFAQTEQVDDVPQSALQARKSNMQPSSSRQSAYRPPSPPSSRQSAFQAASSPQSRARASTFKSTRQSRQTSNPQSRQTSSPQSRQTSSPQSRQSSAPPPSDLSGIHLNFCETATLALIANIRLLGVKFPHQSSSSERAKMAQYSSSLISNFPCDRERDLMNEALRATPAMFSDRPSYNRWAETFSKQVLKGINSPVAINLGNVLVPNKVYKNNLKTTKK